MAKLLQNIILVSALLAVVYSHGMMLDPVGRASRWRFNNSAPPNYDDDGLYCGGIGTQYNNNGGKCGICGDAYNEAAPRPHEFGGLYGEGVIVKEYKSGDVIPIGVKITANHGGYFKLDLCNMDTGKESDECFAKNKITLESGKLEYELQSKEIGWHNTTIKIPDDLICKHCVLRWTYIGANNIHYCEDGTESPKCGPQESFISCADISIKS